MRKLTPDLLLQLEKLQPKFDRNNWKPKEECPSCLDYEKQIHTLKNRLNRFEVVCMDCNSPAAHYPICIKCHSKRHHGKAIFGKTE